MQTLKILTISFFCTVFLVFSAHAKDLPLKVLCTTYPMYIFTRNLVADTPTKAELLLPSDLGCPHSYTLTPKELMKASGDNILIIRNGLGLDDRICDALKKVNPSLRFADTSEGIGNLLESNDCGEVHADHDCHGHSVNPHLFASPFEAKKIVANICEALVKSNPSLAEKYRKNEETYQKKLDALCAEFKAAAGTFKKKSIVTQHDVFDYLARALELKVVAVIQAEPGENPPASEMIGLVGAIRREKAAVIFVEPQYPADFAKVIARNAEIPTAELDPGASGDPAGAPDSYEHVMRKNLKILQKHLGQ